MEIHEALSQIKSIQAQIHVVQTFRGYRPLTVALTSVTAWLGLIHQLLWWPEEIIHSLQGILYWVGLALLNFTMILLDIVSENYFRKSSLQREKTWRALQAFLPCVFAGALLTGIFCWQLHNALWMLPGLWSLLFALGVFASLPQMPKSIIFVGIYYMIAGTVSLLFAQAEQHFSPWYMASSFGMGQLLTAIILWQAERLAHGKS